MKTAIKVGVGLMLAVLIVPFMANGAQASRVVTFGNGSTYTVNRQPGTGDVQKTYNGANGTNVTYSRTCANGECTAVLN